MKYSPYSFSKISYFDTCAHKFKLQYIDEIKVPFTMNFALKKGKYVHEYIENDLVGKPLPLIKEDMGEPEEVRSVKKLIESLYDNNNYQTIKKTVKNSDDFHIELGIGFDENWNPTTYEDAVLFRGFIDLYLIKGDFGVIIDHKTGKFKEKQDFSQNEIYSLWLMKAIPTLEKVKLMFHYVEHDKMNIKVVTRDDMEYIENKFKQKLNLAETEEKFEKSITKLCLYCDFYNHGFCKLSDSEMLSIL